MIRYHQQRGGGVAREREGGLTSTKLAGYCFWVDQRSLTDIDTLSIFGVLRRTRKAATLHIRVVLANNLPANALLTLRLPTIALQFTC